jgi:hypothetical protein
MSARWHGSDHHPPCPGGCGELADEGMTPRRCGSWLGSMRIVPPIGSAPRRASNPGPAFDSANNWAEERDA